MVFEGCNSFGERLDCSREFVNILTVDCVSVCITVTAVMLVLGSVMWPPGIAVVVLIVSAMRMVTARTVAMVGLVALATAVFAHVNPQQPFTA